MLLNYEQRVSTSSYLRGKDSSLQKDDWEQNQEGLELPFKVGTGRVTRKVCMGEKDKDKKKGPTGVHEEATFHLRGKLTASASADERVT